MNFSTLDDVTTSYQRIQEWAGSSVSEQLVLDFRDTGDLGDTGSTTLIVSHAVVDTGLPCKDIADADCNICDDFVDVADYNPFPQDDLILHPGLPSYGYQAASFGPPETVTGVRDTRINFDALVGDLAAKNNKFNCELLKKGGVPSSNNMIVTELYHDQPQLFGFPLVSNPYTDPVPLYTHTVMRLVSAARSTGSVEGSLIAGIDTIGPVCLVYPFLVKSADVGPTAKNIVEHGWLKWGSLFTDNEEYIENALLFPQMSLNDFATPGGIQSGSTVDVVTLSDVPPDPIPADLNDELDALLGRTIIIPTTLNAPGGGAALVNGFAYATIFSYDLTSTPHTVMASFDTTGQPLPAACQ